jgi:hypothetical protein
LSAIQSTIGRGETGESLSKALVSVLSILSAPSTCCHLHMFSRTCKNSPAPILKQLIFGQRRTPGAPRIVEFAVNVGALDIRQSGHFRTQFCVLRSEQPRYHLPQAHQTAVGDLETATVRSQHLWSQAFLEDLDTYGSRTTDM